MTLTTPAESETVVMLNDGTMVPVVVFRGLLDLEQRGIGLSVDASGLAIEVRPWSRLTDEDRTFLRTHKPQVLAALRAIERACHQTIQ